MSLVCVISDQMNAVFENAYLEGVMKWVLHQSRLMCDGM